MFFQAVVNSTTTDDGDAPSLNVDVSTILQIPSPASTDSHDTAMVELIGMTQRSDEHRTFQ